MKKRFLKPLILFVLLGVAVFACLKRWNAWFGNPAEPPYSSSDVPARIQLTPGNAGQFSRNISWQCGDTVAASQLFIVKEATTDTVIVAAEAKVLQTKSGVTVSYRAKLTGLATGAHRYSVCSGGKQSAWYDFTVSADSSFRFVYLGDMQDMLGSNTCDLLTSIGKRTNGAAFWVLGGDVVERPHDQYWNEYFTAMYSIAQTTPVIACPGNHEYLKGSSGKLEERCTCGFSYLADRRVDGAGAEDQDWNIEGQDQQRYQHPAAPHTQRQRRTYDTNSG